MESGDPLGYDVKSALGLPENIGVNPQKMGTFLYFEVSNITE